MEKILMEDNHLKQYTVMVVDDVESDIDILVECLSDTYRVRVAMDGHSALEEIDKDPPDMVLLDIVMPGIDGYEICRRIKQNNRTKDVLVIFVTCLADAVDETRGFELGAVDYITKPLSFSVIRARVKTHLELAEARKELQRQNEILKENIKLRELVEQIGRHDLKNPLQIMLGTARLLAYELPADAQKHRRLLQNQVDACYTMLNMINRSLDLYRMETGRCSLNAKKTDILPLMDMIFLGIKDIIRTMNLEVNMIINGQDRSDDTRFNVFCDELFFYSMMSNLITNAAEASPKGGSLLISFSDTAGITIRIQNQGTVHPEVRNRFFEKFVSYGKHGGTGLGTYSARLIAEIHKGDIHFLTSDEEDKTIVTIDLPDHF